MIERHRARAWLVVFAEVLVLVAGLRLLVDRDPLTGVVGLRWPDDPVILELRRIALLAGLIVGAALAISGTLLQSLLRNPLASPSILGVSSGAALGVIIALYAGGAAGGSWLGQTGAACLGALVVLSLVGGLGRRGGRLDPLSMVLVGVVISTMASAGIMFVQHLGRETVIRDFTRWMMGRLPEDATGMTIGLTGGMTLLLGGVAFGLGRAMDASMLGADEARSVGVSVGRLRLVMFLTAGALAGVAVVLAGPIGFVGLSAPHLARLTVGPNHRMLLCAAALVGATLVVGADAARQSTDLGGGRMPIGIFTTLIGGPTFLYLLLTDRSRL